MQQLVLDLTWVNAGTKDMRQLRVTDRDFGFAAFKLGLLLAVGGLVGDLRQRRLLTFYTVGRVSAAAHPWFC
jgi:hypothetical protein